MIVPMKKITILCLDSDRATAVSTLQDLGLLHVEPLNPPSGEELDALRRRHERLMTARILIGSLEPIPDASACPPVDAAIDQAIELEAQRRELDRRIEQTQAELKRWAPFGRFDPEKIRALAGVGINVRLFFVSGRNLPPVPNTAHVQVLSQNPEGSYVAVLARENVIYPAEEFALPPQAPAQLEGQLAELKTQAAGLQSRLRALARLKNELTAYDIELQDRIDFLSTCTGMGVKGRISLLSGYAPASALSALQTAARAQGWALQAREPAAEDAVPTLVRNPPWIRPVRFLFQLIGVVPGYREVDISAAFLGFYSLFFAMLVADAGYGALLLGLTLILRWRVRSIPRDLIRLLALLAGGTIAWGVLTGSYFGMVHLPAPLARLRIEWLTDEGNLMRLCFLIGSIHLTLAHLWSLIRTLPQPAFLAQAGWIGLIWTLYFTACNMILGETLPAFVLPLLGVSLGLIVLFMTPPQALKTEWHNHLMLPLSVISAFGDVVSYVRLFAVGSAGTAISIAFNQMAFAGGLNSLGSGLSAALILFFAHTLNILLCALAVVVHGVRLNTLEFSGHLGMQWTGTEYKPFRRRTGAADEPTGELKPAPN